MAELNQRGFSAVSTVGDSPDTELHAGDFDLMVIGGGVDAATRERMRTRFKKQNRDVMVLDVYAPTAGQQIARALRMAGYC
ncbi:hypothetical protein [Sorangium sp. So ce385]|uniref:hypothetical protein n=1 Tax=Sorangium sp. So ce385 TaxID=3133308 RepID=UPI003F5B561D